MLDLLPDDGIVDEIAVQVAVSGTRRVRLTEAERDLAAEQIMADGGGPGTVAERLGLSTLEGMQLYKRLLHKQKRAATRG